MPGSGGSSTDWAGRGKRDAIGSILLGVMDRTRRNRVRLAALGGLLAASLVVLLAAPRASAQSSACLDTGLGLYRGWRSLGYNERVRLCADAEQRVYERQEWWREREALRFRQNAGSEYEWEQWRQQECLVNAAACDIPGVHSAPLPPPPPPPPPPR